MKGLALTIGLLYTLSFSSLGQSSFHHMTFDQGLKDLKAIASDDSMHVCSGYTTFPTNGGTDAWVYATDLDGNQLWSYCYGGSNDDQALDICRSGPNHYVVVGYRTEGSNKQYSIFRIDRQGNLDWSRIYRGAGEEYATSVVEASNGDLLVGGTTNSTGPGAYSALIMRLDSSGSPIWMKSSGSNRTQIVNDVAEAADGSIYYTGRTFEVDSLNGDMYLLHVDSNGDKLESNAIGEMYSEIGYGLVIDSKNNPVIVGTSSGYKIQRHAGKIAAIWNPFSTSSNRFRALGMYDNETELRSIKALSGTLDHFTMTGWAGDVLEDNYYAWVVQMDSNLDLKWSNTYGNGHFEYSYDISLQNDSAWTFCGSTNSLTSLNDGYIVSKHNPNIKLCLEQEDSASIVDTLQSVHITNDTIYNQNDLQVDTLSRVDASMIDSIVCDDYCGPGDTLDADFNIKVSTGQSTVAQFTNLDLNADSVHWDFGDSTTGSENLVIHSFRSSGQYIVCMTLYSRCDTDSICKSVGISSSIASNQLSYRIIENGQSYLFQNHSGERLNISVYTVDGILRSHIKLQSFDSYELTGNWIHSQMCIFKVYSDRGVIIERRVLLN